MIPVPEAPWAVELARFSKAFRPFWHGRPVVAVRDVSLRIPRGSVCGLLGPNGSGKSTTLKAIAGLVTPTAGECRVHGEPAGSLAARQLCGYLPESPRFAPHQSAREFLAYCATLAGLPPEAIPPALAAAGLATVDHRRLGTFSKGMMQRLGLAQALLGRPPVLLLDEPASGLAPEGRRDLLALIRKLRAGGTTVVLTSHVFGHVTEVCDQVAILGDGRLLAAGTVHALVGDAPDGRLAAERLEEIYLERVAASA